MCVRVCLYSGMKSPRVQSVILVFLFHFVLLIRLLHGQLYKKGREGNSSGLQNRKSQSQAGLEEAQENQRAAQIFFILFHERV